MSSNEQQLAPELVLIGPLPLGDGFDGGTKISFGILVECWSRIADGPLRVVSTSRAPSKSTLVSTARAALTWWKLAVEIFKTTEGSIVVFNVSTSGITSILPLVLLVKRIKRGKAILRVFGGDIGVEISRSNLKAKFLKLAVKESNSVYVQTKALQKTLVEFGVAKWLPTSRSQITVPIADIDEQKSLKQKLDICYVGHINEDKGIDILMSAVHGLRGVHLYLVGPVTDSKIDPVSADSNVTFLGPISPHSAVIETIARMDMLVMPSKRAAEGYPGAIIEAFSVGVAVAATPLPPLRELLDEGRRGLLLKDFGAQTLREELNKVMHSPGRLDELKLKSRQSFSDFDAEFVNRQFYESVLATGSA